MDSNLNAYEDNHGLTREEYIRMARESCNRNYAGQQARLREDSLGQLDQSNLHMDSTIDPEETLGVVEPKKMKKKYRTSIQSQRYKGFSDRVVQKDDNGQEESYDQRTFSTYGTIEQEVQKEEEDLKSFRVLTIRCICALVLLVTVIFIDKFEVSFLKFNSNAIYEKLVSNQGIEMLEDFFVSLTKGE